MNSNLPKSFNFTFSNDPDTGIYRVGGNQVSISSGKPCIYKIVISFFGEDRYPKIISWFRTFSQPFNMKGRVYSFFNIRGKNLYEQYFKKEIPGRIQVYQSEKSGKGKIRELKPIADLSGIIQLKEKEGWCSMVPVKDINRFDFQIDVKDGLELSEAIENYIERLNLNG